MTLYSVINLQKSISRLSDLQIETVKKIFLLRIFILFFGILKGLFFPLESKSEQVWHWKSQNLKNFSPSGKPRVKAKKAETTLQKGTLFVKKHLCSGLFSL